MIASCLKKKKLSVGMFEEQSPPACEDNSLGSILIIPSFAALPLRD